MKKLLLLLFLITIGYTATAQVTLIPDAAFEQALINLEIDSDGVVNGQVLTSDVSNVIQLILEDGFDINNLTGIEAFSSLEELVVAFSQITSLDVSQNTQLKILRCNNNMLTELNVSSNSLLEELSFGNVEDLAPYNTIQFIDLSNNPSIRYLWAGATLINKINLKNGNNNPDMTIDVSSSVWYDGPLDPDEILSTVCIEVDDEELAQNNLFPYSEWNVYDIHVAVNFSENCVLGTSKFNKGNTMLVYPNPASDVLHINNKTDVAIEKAVLFDISGRMVRQYEGVSAEGLSVSGLEKGMYLLTMFSGKTTQTQKVIIE